MIEADGFMPTCSLYREKDQRVSAYFYWESHLIMELEKRSRFVRKVVDRIIKI